jgi:hypothetical protein
VGNIKSCTASGVGPQCRKVCVGNTMENLREWTVSKLGLQRVSFS